MDEREQQIRDSLERVMENIARAAQSVGRSPTDVRLVVVSKLQPPEVIAAAVRAGVTRLGENYAEEAVEKMARLPAGIEWHMIGHVQSRKAPLVARHFALLHALDSLKLARKLDAQSESLGRVLPLLLEFNLSGEASKSGFDAADEAGWSGLHDEIEQIAALPNLRIEGLMTMPPLFDDTEQTRPFFICLRRLQAHLRSRFPATCWDELSMGTSADYIAAVQEGATYVRIGAAILGPRPQKVPPTGTGQ